MTPAGGDRGAYDLGGWFVAMGTYVLKGTSPSSCLFLYFHHHISYLYHHEAINIHFQRARIRLCGVCPV